MKEHSGTNPYHALGLPTDATPEEIVARAEELFALATSDAERSLLKWARSELMRDPAGRGLHALLEVPGTDYRDTRWDDFDRRFRRDPANVAALAELTGPPTIADFDLAAILGRIVAALLSVPEPDLRSALQNAPVPPGPGAPPLEVTDVLFG